MVLGAGSRGLCKIPILTTQIKISPQYKTQHVGQVDRGADGQERLPARPQEGRARPHVGPQAVRTYTGTDTPPYVCVCVCVTALLIDYLGFPTPFSLSMSLPLPPHRYTKVKAGVAKPIPVKKGRGNKA